MKSMRALVILIVFLTTSLVFARDVERIGVGAPNQTDITVAKANGLKLGKSYSINRNILMRTSWKVENEDSTSHSPIKGYPEIFCGEGYDAICQARFSKNGKYLTLVVNQDKKDLRLAHIYPE
jgi:hypothetical protein